MATIDDLYTQLALAKKEHTPLAAALESRKVEWAAALGQLGISDRTRRTPPAATAGKTYSPNDLPALAIARIKAQSDHDASAEIVTTIQTEIQQAIAAKGA
jgi:hypothetical protein